MVSQACLGASVEKLIGMNTNSPRSVTIIDFFANYFQIYALKAPEFTEKMNH